MAREINGSLYVWRKTPLRRICPDFAEIAVTRYEAAHVKWHAAGGPDTANNGIALCSFHHKVLDRGAMGLSDKLTIDVSQDVHGGSQVEDLLLQYVGKELTPPQSGQEKPLLDYVEWHRSEVFKGPGRI